jgi:Fic family protein
MAKKYPWTDEYPFLSFDFNSESLPPSTWALLGECSSKIEHVLGTPLREDIAKHLNSVFMIRGAHGTTAIEGNTLSEKQVKRIVEGKTIDLPPTQEYLEREVANVLKSYRTIISQLHQGVPFHVTPEELKKLNQMVLDGLECEKDVVPGEYRLWRVGVNDYRCPQGGHIEHMVKLGCDMLNAPQWQKAYAGVFVVPILRAILSHLYIAWIHPFGDGNGRTARLLEFDLLVRAGVPIPCAHLLSDYYNRTRPKYYRALSMAQQSAKHFVCYAIEGFRELLKEQIELIRVQVYEVTWQNYVYSMFRKFGKSVTAERQREVALFLGTQADRVKPYDIPTLSPKLAELYHGKTGRTIRRDVSMLLDMKLIVWEKAQVRANRGLVLAFLPEQGAAISPDRAVPKSIEAA